MNSAATVMEALGWTLVHFVWEGAAIAAVVWLVMRGLVKAAPVWRYAAAVTAMAGMLIAVGATLWWHWPAGRGGTAAVAVHDDLAVVMRERAGGREASQAAGLIGGEPGMAAAPRIDERPAMPETPEGRRLIRVAAATERLRSWLPWIVWAWAVGVVVVLTRLGHGWWWVRRMRREAVVVPAGPWSDRFSEIAHLLRVSRPVRLLSSATARVPMVIGWLKPVVIVPAALFTGLPAAQLEAILAHELAHIRRNDSVVNWLQCLVEALLFYHPAVWWVSIQVRTEREHCCDDVAARLCGGALPYAKALTALEEWRGDEPILGLAANGRPLLQRIRRLLGVRETATVGWPGVVALFALALVPLGLVFGGAEPSVVASQASYIGDGGWSSYCVHTGGETQFLFLAQGEFSSSTRSHHDPVTRTWQDDGTLRFPDGRELSFQRSSEAPDDLVVEDSRPGPRFRLNEPILPSQHIEAADEAGAQGGPVKTFSLFDQREDTAPKGPQVAGDRISFKFSLSRGRVLLLDGVKPGIHQLKLPLSPVTSTEKLATARRVVESAAVAQATAQPGLWTFPGGATLRLYGELFHATDVMTTALISWPAQDGRPPVQWHTGIASDAFTSREEWAVAWEKEKPVLWVASRTLGSAENSPDGRPVANQLKRIDFSDPSHILEDYYQDGWPEVDG
ncbi:MAG: M56 family metallopeptidase, partial [Verrucomicrobiales bacterium]